jgi:hypothetical protein
MTAACPYDAMMTWTADSHEPNGSAVVARAAGNSLDPDRESGPLARVAFGLVIGFASAVLGLAPWLVTGARLPLQNLWRAEALPEEMPISLLPVSQYHATTIAVLLFVGGVTAGLAVWAIRPRVRVPFWSAASGVLCAHGVAVIQSFSVVASGLRVAEGGADSRSFLYFAGMLGGTLAAVVLSQAVLWLTSRRGTSAVFLAVALSAVPFTSWVVLWIATLSGPAGPPSAISWISTWLPAVIVAAVIGWCGVRPLRRLWIWILSLGALWILPAIMTAVTSALGMRVLDGDPAAMVEVASQIFPVALGINALPALSALLLGAILAGVRLATRRGSQPSAEQSADGELTS